MIDIERNTECTALHPTIGKHFPQYLESAVREPRIGMKEDKHFSGGRVRARVALYAAAPY
jgi:hypothetical protein